MANISNEIRAFQNAVYGEEVRSSMISAIQKINTVTESCESTVNSFSSNISSATTAANNAASNANTAATNANNAATAANTAKNAANTAASNANAAVTSANNAASNASAAATSANNAEAARVTAENSRANAESTRQANESARQSAEQARVSAEATRANSESARDSAESARQINEITRQGNERQRQNSETLRENAESSRASGFSDMQAAFADMQRTVIPQATESTMGGVIVGGGLSVDDALLSLAATKSGSGTAVASNGAILESVVVYGQSDQEGTPTPSEPVDVQVVQGGNLQSYPTTGSRSQGNVTIEHTGSRVDNVTLNAAASSNVWSLSTAEISDNLIHLDAGTYTASCPSGLKLMVRTYDGTTWTWVASYVNPPYTFTLPEAIDICTFYSVPSGAAAGTYEGWVQLEAGTTATPYVPYGSIGIVVGDTVTAIDLQGNTLASLPDGTRDELHVDSAGRVWINKRTGRILTPTDVSNVINLIQITGGARWKINVDGLNSEEIPDGNTNGYCSHTPFKRSISLGSLGSHVYTYGGQAYYVIEGDFTANSAVTWVNSHQMTIIYPLATPQTIDLGYIDPPAIPEDGATVSVSASITPVIDVSWWENGAAAIASAISKLMDEIKSLKAQIAALATS